MSDIFEPAARLAGILLGRPLDAGETRAVGNQASRAGIHAVMTTMVAPGELFTVEPGQYDATMAKLAKERRS